MSTITSDNTVNIATNDSKHRMQLASPWFQISPDLKPRTTPKNAATQMANCGSGAKLLLGQSQRAMLYNGTDTITIPIGMAIADTTRACSVPIFGLRTEQWPTRIAEIIAIMLTNIVTVNVVNAISTTYSTMV